MSTAKRHGSHSDLQRDARPDCEGRKKLLQEITA
jgi:hypothetical protein